MQRTPVQPTDDEPKAESGGTRTPAGGTYGDFVPRRRHDGRPEPYDDESKGPTKPAERDQGAPPAERP
jgi:hypothetical protein